MSHGQPSDPDPAEAALARQAPDMPGWFVQTATLAKRGSLEAALARAGAAPVIYPMFMTDGWFVRSALPKRLRGVETPVILPPLGVDPGLPDVALQALAAELDRQGWSAAGTTLLVAAHGSGRSRNSARDTRRFVDRLGERVGFADMRIGYVEEPPHLDEAATLCPRQSICLPFFAADGGHVQEDIPQALQETGFTGPCMAPVGLLPGIGGLMARAIEGAPVAGE